MATERFEAHEAPGGLALVQDLVNTHGVSRYGADLLADQAAAQLWLGESAGQWARARGLDLPNLAVSEDDLPALRKLRSGVREMLAIPPGQRPSGPFDGAGGVTWRAQAHLVTDQAGWVALAPAGTGAGWLEPAVWSEILLAQRGGTWSRVKLCREPRCRTAFYDASRNSSGAWHNVRACGNVTNLRASRARRKAQEASPDSSA
jgi:hypothetical protein